MTARSRARVRFTIVLIAFVLAAGGAGAALIARSDTRSPQGAPTPTRQAGPDTAEPPATPPVTTPTGAMPANAAAAELTRLKVMPAVESTPALARISGETTQQPDLYAAEFVRRLLTHDHAHPRDAVLSWVQAESATTTDPLVVGMVPAELRDKLTVFSVTDDSYSPAPVPNPREWASLAAQHATTRAVIDHVEEPYAWTNAVSSGRVTDPGLTARDVSATLTRTIDVGGHRRTSSFSVAVTLNLEGPPTRATWGCVAVISYTAVQVS